MGISNGQAVDAANTNPAFLDANADDTAQGKIGLANVDAVSGAALTNIQREHNSAASFIGKTLNSAKDDLPSYTNNQGFTNPDSLKDRLDDVSAKFHNSTGHAHTGAAGDAPQIPYSSLSGIQLQGFAIKGTNLTGVTGGSTDVSTPLTGETESSGSTVAGVVTTAPLNYVEILDANGDHYLDGSDNKVYGRLTKSGATWTLTYYSLVSGVQTAYSFTGSNTVQWFYQKLYAENNRPVYSDHLSIRNSTNRVAGTSSGGGGGGAAPYFFDEVVGTAGQVTAGEATQSSISAAHTAMANSDSALILKGTHSGWTNTKKILWQGLGYGSVISSAITLDAGSEGAILDKVRVQGDINVNTSGVICRVYFDSSSYNFILDDAVDPSSVILEALQL